MEFRSVFFRDRSLFFEFGFIGEELIESVFPLCRLTISLITRRSVCREKAII